MSGFGPPILNSSIRSWNWPWMSPQTVTGHFCCTRVSTLAAEGWAFGHIRLVGRWIRPGELPAPVIPGQLGATDGWHASRGTTAQSSLSGVWCCRRRWSPSPASHLDQGANLLTKPLDVCLCELFAVHQTLDPAVERGNGGRLQGRCGGKVCGNAPDILHVSIHSDRWGLSDR